MKVMKSQLYNHKKTERGPYRALQFCKLQSPEGVWEDAIAYCLEDEFNDALATHINRKEPTIYVRTVSEFEEKFSRSPSVRPPRKENPAEAVK